MIVSGGGYEARSWFVRAARGRGTGDGTRPGRLRWRHGDADSDPVVDRHIDSCGHPDAGPHGDHRGDSDGNRGRHPDADGVADEPGGGLYRYGR